jgi:hypothetical protein
MMVWDEELIALSVQAYSLAPFSLVHLPLALDLTLG